MNLGASEILLILLIVLLFFGGKRLPELARSIGKGLSDFQKATQDVTHDLSAPEEPVRMSDSAQSNLRYSGSNTTAIHTPHASQSRTSEKPSGTDS
ncbi:twin-arginine translocase TatA/TatE family subunit [candidate division KSB1 bacterium]|nr:MAG: twin-arginine translocase TatA/TatE family subunit [candidate division KSB1 bacterium]